MSLAVMFFIIIFHNNLLKPFQSEGKNVDFFYYTRVSPHFFSSKVELFILLSFPWSN